MNQSTSIPAVIVDAAELDHLESLAANAMQRQPAVADKLLDELGRAEIVETDRMPRDVVTIGSRVTFRNESTRAEQTITLVYPEDADISRGCVSIVTPIGAALLGLAEGAQFAWDARDSTRHQLTVLKVEPPVRD
ncbi:nucleoside diphosphate kinase regulator [Roseovarius sp. SCSIO 43702]|uniref:nucleoside diphosphate kinase regulator n=1 Tax=Roseovarius sp. SCSIO 43702 TaxID=2823043 RepID=UPI001C731BAE|nr:nucleoside diphosphate kinase regulator [Roseovarius sp. SCSIO 43702]QYX58206.1 nucleoside diphosphate kinase regulator [Roseovarius sp. SCSIO 43702]